MLYKKYISVLLVLACIVYTLYKSVFYLSPVHRENKGTVIIEDKKAITTDNSREQPFWGIPRHSTKHYKQKTKESIYIEQTAKASQNFRNTWRDLRINTTKEPAISPTANFKTQIYIHKTFKSRKYINEALGNHKYRRILRNLRRNTARQTTVRSPLDVKARYNEFRLRKSVMKSTTKMLEKFSSGNTWRSRWRNMENEQQISISNSQTTSRNLWDQLYLLGPAALPEKYQAFRPAIEVNYFHLYLDILATFAKTMESNNLTYFMYGGTLIGSLRHHGPIMWDDDVDVMVNFYDREKIIKVFQSLAPKYYFYSTESMNQWKFYSSESIPARPPLQWSWPFIDIFFYQISGNALRDVTYTDWTFNTDTVFPLRKRPFANLTLFAPRCSWEFTNKKYDINLCISTSWDHQHQEKIEKPIQTIRCSKIRGYYPFVNRREMETGVTEELVYKNQIIHVFKEEACTFKRTY